MRRGNGRALEQRDMERASRTMVPTNRSPPPVKKLHMGYAPFISSTAPTPVTMIDTLVMCRSGKRAEKAPTAVLMTGATRPRIPIMIPHCPLDHPYTLRVNMGRPSMYACEAHSDTYPASQDRQKG